MYLFSQNAYCVLILTECILCTYLDSSHCLSEWFLCRSHTGTQQYPQILHTPLHRIHCCTGQVLYTNKQLSLLLIFIVTIHLKCHTFQKFYLIFQTFKFSSINCVAVFLTTLHIKVPTKNSLTCVRQALY